MIDRYGRKIEYLRLSVTQNCDMKCIYCVPCGADSIQPCAAGLTPEELERIVRSMARMGIRKVRITGGEPLTRADVCDIIERIAGIREIEDLSMTTNGVKLDRLAEKLKAAGLMRLNISLDSLREERFKYITGGGRLENTRKGLEKALEAGLQPVRVNTVLIKGLNDDEIDDFILLSKDLPLEVRFIELMPIGSYGEENADKIVYNSDIIKSRPALIPCEAGPDAQPARYYRLEGYQGKVGFISPMSHRFCSGCNRIRLTCDGKVKPCLGNNAEADITAVLRENPEKLDALIEEIIYRKPAGHHFGKDFSSIRNMNGIGG